MVRRLEQKPHAGEVAVHPLLQDEEIQQRAEAEHRTEAYVHAEPDPVGLLPVRRLEARAAGGPAGKFLPEQRDDEPDAADDEIGRAHV